MSSDVGLLPNADAATFFDAGGQQQTAMSYTALLSDHILAPDISQQTRTMDISYPHQMNPLEFVDLHNNGNEASSKGFLV